MRLQMWDTVGVQIYFFEKFFFFHLSGSCVSFLINSKLKQERRELFIESSTSDLNICEYTEGLQEYTIRYLIEVISVYMSVFYGFPC